MSDLILRGGVCKRLDIWYRFSGVRCVVFHNVLIAGLKFEVQHCASCISIFVYKTLHFGGEFKNELVRGKCDC